MSASDKKKLRKEQVAAARTEKQQQAQKEAKKLKIMTISFITILALVFVCFGWILVDNYLTVNGVFEKRTIVANIDGYEMNTVEFSYYYVDAIQDYYDSYYNEFGQSAAAVMSMYGLNISKPLNEQTNPETGSTWDDYFIEVALGNAKNDIALYNKAMAEGFDKNHEDVQSIVNNAKNSLSWQALFYGSVDKYIHNFYCNGGTEAGYLDYVERSAIAATYYAEHQNSIEYDDAALEAYQKDRYHEFSSLTFNTYLIDYTKYLNEEEATKDENGKITYTTEQHNAARAAAKLDAEKLSQCKSLEEFNAAIAALPYNSAATTPVTSTLNEDVLYSQLKDDYAKWLGDPARVEGDMKVFDVETEDTINGETVKVVNSIYVMMYRSTNENLMNLSNVRHLLVEFKETTDDKGNTTITDAAKAEAKAEAEKLYKEWQDNGSKKDDLIAMIKEHSDDTNKDEGGLFENITPDTQFVTEFLNWSVDPERKEGDHAIIETQYGHHIMYFDGYSEQTYRDYLVEMTMLNDDMKQWYEGILEASVATLKDDSRLKHDFVLQAS